VADFDELEKLRKKVLRRAGPAPGRPGLEDLFPATRRPPEEPSGPARLAPLPDLGDLVSGPAPEGPRDAPSLESRLRLDLGDLEPRPAREELPELPRRHPDLSELSDAGGWVVVDLGEWEAAARQPWSKKKAEPSRREDRYGAIPVGDLPEDQPVSGAVMSLEEALEVARQLNSLRDVMES